MRYLSIDLEATGLEEHDLIIEFGMVPFDAQTKTIEHDLGMQFFVHCPSFQKLKPQLNPWVIEHNKTLIETAHSEGISLKEFQNTLLDYICSAPIQEYFSHKKIVLFGKSMNSIDLPFLKRDLGWEFMNTFFHHRINDLSSNSLGLIDLGLLKEGSDSGEVMMRNLNMGEVEHTALEDAINTAKMYLKIIKMWEDARSDNLTPLF